MDINCKGFMGAVKTTLSLFLYCIASHCISSRKNRSLKDLTELYKHRSIVNNALQLKFWILNIYDMSHYIRCSLLLLWIAKVLWAQLNTLSVLLYYLTSRFIQHNYHIPADSSGIFIIWNGTFTHIQYIVKQNMF